MHRLLVTTLLYLGLTVAQQVGTWQEEIHPRLQWSTCSVAGGCKNIDGEIVMDANWRWLHEAGGYKSCYSYGTWDDSVCNSAENCTNTCAVEGAQYKQVYGVTTANDSVSLKFRTNFDFSYNIGSRLFLMESKNKYQMFTLGNNELAFDVDLSTVECGINSALYFVPMDQDGGQARYPTNKAGAEYGTGYCDATCPRDLRFVGGRANSEGWMPSETDEFGGKGALGSCCPQFSVWNSNAHSFAMSSHICPDDGPQQFPYICKGENCDFYPAYSDDRGPRRCDFWGCSYNPYRMGNIDFYGKGKTVDTAKKFTVVTRWTDTRVTQFLIQDGHKFDMPTPVWDGLPTEGGLSGEMCSKQAVVFDERARFDENGGWSEHNKQLLNRPMVLTMSITADHYAWNTWLDAIFPPYDSEGLVGRERGDCRPIEDNDPRVVQNKWPTAKVVWSNIRFGPIGSTVKI